MSHSCPHTHQQNGFAERKHRHIVETDLTLLAHASMPFSFGMRLSLLLLFSLTGYLLLCLTMPLLLLLFLVLILLILFCAHLAVPVGRIFTHIKLTNFPSGLCNACFLVIALITRV
jgi:hypothetical protein